jgi:preprotein translocase subunit YajC
MFITPAYAQSLGLGEGTSSTLVQIAPLALIFVVFYFFLIRPQQQKAKDQKAMLSGIRRGDRVVTGGGLIGTVSKVVGDTELLIELAEGIRVRAVRSTVTTVLARTEPAASKSNKGKDADEDEDEPAEAAADKPAEKAKTGVRRFF